MSARGASAAAIRHHYDAGEDFYRLWLDPTLTYSCALWAEGRTLEEAQVAKIDHLLTAARAHGVHRLLDVGCGWGSVLRRAVETYGVGHAVGLTLSQAQAEWVTAQRDARYEARLEGWADHEVDVPYDAVVSIGAMEHFARLGLTAAEKIDAYREFFERCHSMSAPGSWMALQVIARGDAQPDARTMRDLIFIAREIFPESDLPRPIEILEASRGWYEPVVMRNDREHYARTCREWAQRLHAVRADAVAASSEQVVARYERYLPAGARLFEEGHTLLLRFALRRCDRPSAVRA